MVEWVGRRRHRSSSNNNIQVVIRQSPLADQEQTPPHPPQELELQEVQPLLIEYHQAEDAQSDGSNEVGGDGYEKLSTN